MKALWSAGVDKTPNQKMLFNFITIGYTDVHRGVDFSAHQTIDVVAPCDGVFHKDMYFHAGVPRWQVNAEIRLGRYAVELLFESGDSVSEAQAQDYDAIVLDLSMPGIDGLETLKRIKANNPNAEIIMLTGHGSVEAGVEALRAEAFDFLLKPVSPDQLVEVILAAVAAGSSGGG